MHDTAQPSQINDPSPRDRNRAVDGARVIRLELLAILCGTLGAGVVIAGLHLAGYRFGLLKHLFGI